VQKFILLFDEKEGTSPAMRLLDRFERVAIVHQIDNKGWEPFDRHNCGPMPLSDLKACLRMIYGDAPVDMQSLNALYGNTATRPLESFSNQNAVGMKMRFRAPQPTDAKSRIRLPWTKSADTPNEFKQMMFALFRESNVVVFIAVRQDTLRWALSKYHGDGSGQQGHLQFKLASGKIRREDIGRIHVDPAKLEKVLQECEQAYAKKQQLRQELLAAGVTVALLRYEDYLADKRSYLEQFFNVLQFPVSEEETATALANGDHFQKVHADDISEFVENHEEVLNRFGDRFRAWE